MNIKRKWVEKEIGTEILAGCDDTIFDHYYRGMHDYGMGFYEADKWAWLNTLFGYDIGAERALALINRIEDDDFDVLDLDAEIDKDYVEDIANEIGLHLDFSGWPDKTPFAIVFEWPTHL